MISVLRLSVVLLPSSGRFSSQPRILSYRKSMSGRRHTILGHRAASKELDGFRVLGPQCIHQREVAEEVARMLRGWVDRDMTVTLSHSRTCCIVAAKQPYSAERQEPFYELPIRPTCAGGWRSAFRSPRSRRSPLTRKSPRSYRPNRPQSRAHSIRGT